jgi:hypothetical protein
MKNILRRWIFITLALACIAGSVPALAQVQNASLTGLVVDPSGAVVRGATVTVKNSATNVALMQETDLSGY